MPLKTNHVEQLMRIKSSKVPSAQGGVVRKFGKGGTNTGIVFDWWNSTSFSQYYKKWNAVVYDWLYAYVYIDLNQTGLSRSLSLVLVFIFSSAIHEYLIALSLGFFYPVLAVTYLTVGVSLVFVTKNRKTQFWNTFMWSMLFAGWGVVICLYCTEWFARINCKGLDNPIQDFFVPRSWSESCHIITFS
ncbi:sterol O-acyltransferase 2 [Trichonephila clavipes]|nr:sterol O-acyltransferase 2 [Trichonephila clavipes]